MENNHPHITKVLDLFKGENLSQFRKIHRMIDLFESIIKTNTAILISNYFSNQVVSDHLKGLFAEGLRTPSLGLWRVFGQVLYNELAFNQFPIPFYEQIKKQLDQGGRDKLDRIYIRNESVYVLRNHVELKKVDGWRSFLYREIYTKQHHVDTSFLEKRFFIEGYREYFYTWDRSIEPIIAKRNHYAHGSTPEEKECEADIKALEDTLNKWLKAKWITNTAIITFMDDQLNTYPIHGIVSSFFTDNIKEKFILKREEIKQNRPYLVKKDGTFLESFPIMLLKFLKDQNQYSYMFFNNFKSKNANYLNYPYAYQYKGEDLYYDFLSVIDIEKWKQNISDDFRHLIEELTENFKGRKVEIQKIEKLINQKKNGWIFVFGNPGLGKSALLAKILEPRNTYTSMFQDDIQSTNQLDPENFYVIRYFIKRNLETARIENLLDYLFNQLETNVFQTNISIGQTLESKSQALKQQLQIISKHLHDKKLVLIIDGLDELLDRNKEYLSLLPTNLYKNIIFIYSSRFRPEIEKLQSSLPVELTERIDLEGLTKDDIRAMISEVANKYEIEKDYINYIDVRSEGNPLYVNLLCMALDNKEMNLNDYEILPHKHEKFITFYKGIMNRFKEQKNGAFSLKVLFTIACAEDYLSTKQLQLILGPVDITEVEDAILTIREVLIQESGRECYQLFHTTFLEFLEEYYFDELRESHQKIVSYCEKWNEFDIYSRQVRLYPFKFYKNHLETLGWDDRILTLAKKREYLDQQVEETKEFTYTFQLLKSGIQIAIKKGDIPSSINLAEAIGNYHLRVINHTHEILTLLEDGRYDNSLPLNGIFKYMDLHEKIIFFLLFLLEMLKSKSLEKKKNFIEDFLDFGKELFKHTNEKWNQYIPWHIAFRLLLELDELQIKNTVIHKHLSITDYFTVIKEISFNSIDEPFDFYPDEWYIKVESFISNFDVDKFPALLPIFDMMEPNCKEEAEQLFLACTICQKTVVGKEKEAFILTDQLIQDDLRSKVLGFCSVHIAKQHNTLYINFLKKIPSKQHRFSFIRIICNHLKSADDLKEIWKTMRLVDRQKMIPYFIVTALKLNEPETAFYWFKKSLIKNDEQLLYLLLSIIKRIINKGETNELSAAINHYLKIYKKEKDLHYIVSLKKVLPLANMHQEVILKLIRENIEMNIQRIETGKHPMDKIASARKAALGYAAVGEHEGHKEMIDQALSILYSDSIQPEPYFENSFYRDYAVDLVTIGQFDHSLKIIEKMNINEGKRDKERAIRDCVNVLMEQDELNKALTFLGVLPNTSGEFKLLAEDLYLAFLQKGEIEQALIVLHSMKDSAYKANALVSLCEEIIQNQDYRVQIKQSLEAAIDILSETDYSLYQQVSMLYIQMNEWELAKNVLKRIEDITIYTQIVIKICHVLPLSQSVAFMKNCFSNTSLFLALVENTPPLASIYTNKGMEGVITFLQLKEVSERRIILKDSLEEFLPLLTIEEISQLLKIGFFSHGKDLIQQVCLQLIENDRLADFICLLEEFFPLQDGYEVWSVTAERDMVAKRMIEQFAFKYSFQDLMHLLKVISSDQSKNDMIYSWVLDRFRRHTFADVKEAIDQISNQEDRSYLLLKWGQFYYEKGDKEKVISIIEEIPVASYRCYACSLFKDLPNDDRDIQTICTIFQTAFNQAILEIQNTHVHLSRKMSKLFNLASMYADFDAERTVSLVKECFAICKSYGIKLDYREISTVCISFMLIGEEEQIEFLYEEIENEQLHQLLLIKHMVPISAILEKDLPEPFQFLIKNWKQLQLQQLQASTHDEYWRIKLNWLLFVEEWKIITSKALVIIKKYDLAFQLNQSQLLHSLLEAGEEEIFQQYLSSVNLNEKNRIIEEVCIKFFDENQPQKAMQCFKLHEGNYTYQKTLHEICCFYVDQGELMKLFTFLKRCSLLTSSLEIEPTFGYAHTVSMYETIQEINFVMVDRLLQEKDFNGCYKIVLHNKTEYPHLFIETLFRYCKELWISGSQKEVLDVLGEHQIEHQKEVGLELIATVNDAESLTESVVRTMYRPGTEQDKKQMTSLFDVLLKTKNYSIETAVQLIGLHVEDISYVKRALQLLALKVEKDSSDKLFEIVEYIDWGKADGISNNQEIPYTFQTWEQWIHQIPADDQIMIKGLIQMVIDKQISEEKFNTKIQKIL